MSHIKVQTLSVISAALNVETPLWYGTDTIYAVFFKIQTLVLQSIKARIKKSKPQICIYLKQREKCI